MNKNFIVLYVIGILAIIFSIIALFKHKNDVNIDNLSTVANNIILKEENGVLKWKYSSDSNWNELYNLLNLKGTDGTNGTNGKNGSDGAKGKNGINGKDGIDGKDGINGTDGKDGVDGKDGINGTNGKDGVDGKDGINGTNGKDGVDGKDGREVELRAEGSVIQWRYIGESTWNDLLDVASIDNSGVSESNNLVYSVDGDTENLGCYNLGTNCTNGSLFKINVNDNVKLDFYVVSSDDTTITLIAGSNIGNNEFKTVAWYTASSGNYNYGPITALTVLNTLTADWTNLQAISYYNYDNTGGGYKNIRVTDGETVVTDATDNTTIISGVTRARLLTYDEAYSLGCRVTASASNCPAWLYDNLAAETNSLTPYGYWLSTSYANNNKAYNIRNTGVLANNSVNDTTGRGIRPVITIKKI